MSRPRRNTEPAATETEMLDLLERSLAKPGNGGSGEYAFMRHVRNAAGFDAKRTFDGVALGLWPSRGHDLHIYEVKVSRSDWLRELNDPAKAEDAAKIGDRFSIVAPRGVGELAEVPAIWGYIEASGGVEVFEPGEVLFEGHEPGQVRLVEGRKLRTVRAAPLLRPPEQCRGPISRSLLVCLLRAAGAVPEVVAPQQRVIDAAVSAAVLAERDRHDQAIRAERTRYDRDLALHRRFMREAGLWSLNEDTVTERAADVRQAMQALQGPRHARAQLQRTVEDVERTLASLRRALDTMAEDKEPVGAG